jgi:hypothetical protein
VARIASRDDPALDNVPPIARSGIRSCELGGDEREPDVPGPLRARLPRSGYIKVDGGFLIETDRYVPADRIASVSDDTVHLKVSKDQLIKEA